MNEYASIEWLIALSRMDNSPRARDARLALAERGDEALPALLDAVLDDTLPGGNEFVPIIGEIGFAVGVGTRHGGENAVRVLIEILNAPHLRRLRAAACEALCHTRSGLAVDPLVAVMNDDHTKPIACVAARALVWLGCGNTGEPLRAAARSDSPYLRSATLMSLDWSEQAAYLRDPDPYVRLAAIKYLSYPDLIPFDPWEAAPLRDCLAELKEDMKSSDRTIAAVAAVMLAQSKESEIETETDEALIEYLCFGSIPEVRRAAAVALGYIGTDDAAPELLRTLTTDKNDGVRRAAAEALYRIGTYRGRAALVEAKGLVKEPMRTMILDLLKD